MKNPYELLVGKKPSKKQYDKNLEQEIIPIHEESGDIIKDRLGLSLDQQDQTIINEHLNLNNKGLEDAPSKEKKFIPIEDITENFDLETFILNKIDNPDNESEEDINEIKTPATIHTPQFVKDIIQKYSLQAEEWKKLSPEQKNQRKQTIQEEIRNLYVKGTIQEVKKMMPKEKNKKENTEIAA